MQNRRRIAALQLLVLVFLVAGNVEAATFTVTRTNTTGPGSLPVIINTANATPGDNIIEFSVAGTIGMVVPLPVITNNLTINGRSNIVISGSGVTNLFAFGTGTTNVLYALTIQDATVSGYGAAVSNAGTLIISGCLLTNNKANKLNILSNPGQGGAIYNVGVLTLVGCSFVSNKAGFGGAIFSDNTTAIVASSISGNESTNGFGGAIYSSALLSISDSSLTDNFTTNLTTGQNYNYGGAIYSSGPMTLTNSTLARNTSGNGGGIYCLGPLAERC